MDYTTGKELTDLGTTFVQMKLITRNPDQPRQEFDQQSLEDLALNIDENGLLQPIVIRKISNYGGTPGSVEDSSKYMIVAGERRFRAHCILNREVVQARIIKCTDRKAYELSLLENLEREDINLLEEAQAYHRLKAEFKYNLEQLGKVVSKSPSNISNIMGVMKESERVRGYVRTGVLTLALLVWLKQLPNEHEKLELLRKLEAEEIKRTHAKAYIQHIVKAYKIALELGIDPAEILKEKKKGVGGRFDIKSDDIIPPDFRFFFIIDNLIGKEDLNYFPQINILVSAFTYLHSKGSSKQLAQLLLSRSSIEHLFMDSGVVPASKKGEWSFFEKSDQLFQFYNTIKPDICVSLDIPAYAPVFDNWKLTIREVLDKTIANAEKFLSWEPSFPTVKVYALQGTEPKHYLECFLAYKEMGIFEKDEKVALAFGAIARNKIELIEEKVRIVVQHPEFQEILPKLEFVHGFGIGQANRICRLYQLGVNSFDALTCTIVTATGQYLLRNGKYYAHIAHESPLMRKVRFHFNVNSFWGNLTHEFAKVKGVDKLADAERKGVDKYMEKLDVNFGDSIIDND